MASSLFLAPGLKSLQTTQKRYDFKACTHLQRPCAENIVTWIRDCRGPMMMACAPCWSWSGTLIAAGLLSSRGRGHGGEKVVRGDHTSAPWAYVLKGSLEILGDHSYLSKQKLSCQDRKCCYLGFIKFSSGCFRVCWYSIHYREISAHSWAASASSPGLPVPVFLTQRIQFLKTFMRPFSPLPTQQKSFLEDGHPSSNGTHRRVLQTCKALSAGTALTLGGTLRSELESLFQEKCHPRL